MLSVIPGVSINIAKKIHEKYNTFNDLILAYQSTVDEKNKELLLADIQFTATRKVGKSISKKIYCSITGK
jgi:hypothetical protein